MAEKATDEATDEATEEGTVRRSDTFMVETVEWWEMKRDLLIQ